MKTDWRQNKGAMALRKLTYLVIVISMLKRTCQSESLTAPCKSVLVNGAELYGCDGLYNITTQITPKLRKGKPVYKNTNKNRFMYFINPFYGWVLSSQNGLQNFMYYYASRLDTYGPTMGVWRPMRNKSVNITVICQDPIVNKNSTRNKNVNDTVGDMMTKDKVNGADVQFLVSSSPAMDNRKIFNRNMFTIICVLSLLL
jgi:hypothetical protein